MPGFEHAAIRMLVVRTAHYKPANGFACAGKSTVQLANSAFQTVSIQRGTPRTPQQLKTVPYNVGEYLFLQVLVVTPRVGGSDTSFHVGA